MPFTKSTAAVAGQRGGFATAKARKESGAEDRKTNVKLSVTPSEFQMLNEKARVLGLSRTELIIRAVESYEPEEPD